MTVGIAAISGKNAEPRAVLVADRMVTTGHSTTIEYEHTESKIEPLMEGNAKAMAIASGSLSLADDLFLKLGDKLVEETPDTVHEITNLGVTAFHEMQQESFNNQKLEPLNLSLSDFKNDEVNLAPQLQEAILSDVYELKEQIEAQLNVIIAGIDDDGAHIYSLAGGDKARHDKIGYATTGSGSQSAQLAFIRNRYDANTDLDDALLSAVEAKIRAEEAQGVGTQMDVAIIGPSRTEKLEEDDIEELRELIDEIEERQNQLRRNTIDDSDKTFVEGDTDEA